VGGVLRSGVAIPVEADIRQSCSSENLGSAGVMIAFGLLAIVDLVMYWSTNVQRCGESDRTTKDAPY